MAIITGASPYNRPAAPALSTCRTAWAEVTTALKGDRTRLEQACAKLDAEVPGALGQARPALETFYAALNDEQKRMLDSHGGPRRWH
jgi:hypothetical protein